MTEPLPPTWHDRSMRAEARRTLAETEMPAARLLQELGHYQPLTSGVPDHYRPPRKIKLAETLLRLGT